MCEPLGQGANGRVVGSDDEEVEEVTEAARMRGGAVEEALRSKPFVKSFSQKHGKAGKVYNLPQTATSRESYAKSVHANPTNPYAPFVSKMDWEIGKWAKLRGPSSTSFTELMAIDGVRTRFFSISAHYSDISAAAFRCPKLLAYPSTHRPS